MLQSTQTTNSFGHKKAQRGHNLISDLPRAYGRIAPSLVIAQHLFHKNRTGAPIGAMGIPMRIQSLCASLWQKIRLHSRPSAVKK